MYTCRLSDRAGLWMYVIHVIRTFVLPIQEDQYDDEALRSARGRVEGGIEG